MQAVLRRSAPGLIEGGVRAASPAGVFYRGSSPEPVGALSGSKANGVQS